MYYPRSFLKFILLGFLLVSLPLLYALGELILSLDQLQTQGREAVQQAAQAGRASRQLFEQAGTLERIVRQHLILDDSALLDDYDRVRQEFRATAAQLALLPLGVEPLAALDALTDSESRLHKLLTMPQRSADTQTQLADGYARLADRTQAMLAASNQLTENAIERLQEIATQGRQKWLYLALATAAIALALAILFAVLIARPIRQLDQAIRRMGTADFTHRIEVNGPQDLRYLGQRLEWLRSRLSELEEQQNRFLRHVSHELKTPLTAVREGAELLRDNVGGKLSAEQREIVRIVRQNTLSLQKLIEDLLTYHQTRAMEPQTVGPVALPDVVRRVLREHKLAAFARMVTFEQQLAPALVRGRRRQGPHDRRQSRLERDQVFAAFGADHRVARRRRRLRGARRDRPRSRASIRRSASGSSIRSTRARRRSTAASRARASDLRSRASTRWRMAAASRCAIAPTASAAPTSGSGCRWRRAMRARPTVTTARAARVTVAGGR